MLPGVLRGIRSSDAASWGERTVADTHCLGCNRIGEVLATLGAIDVSSAFDHGKSVADA